MFYKYASNVLQELSDECMLRSYGCKNSNDAELFKSISHRIDWVITKIAVEKTGTLPNKTDA